MKEGLVQGTAVAVNLFIKTYPITAPQVVSISSFIDMFVPTHNTLILWVSKWCEERTARVWDQQNAQSVRSLKIQIEKKRPHKIHINQLENMIWPWS
jgi:hypothetical protein